jgi:hypothetical protein
MRTLLLIAVGLVLAGCGAGSGEAGQWETVTRKISRGRAADVEFKINMPVGEMSLTGGAAELLDGTFRFAGDLGRPEVIYEEGIRGRLTIQPLRKDTSGGQARWELRLADGLPVEVNVNMGAGRADLDLGSLDLRRVSINGGAGDLVMDLRGRPKQDYAVNLNGGVGRVKVFVPGQVGVRARVNGGIGGVDTEGQWTRSGREYQTVNFEEAKTRIEMRVNGGIGTIKLIAVE